MTERNFVVISRTVFIMGIIATILASTVVSTVVSFYFAKGPKGDQGEAGPEGVQGPQGLRGIQGPPGVVTIENFSAWMLSPAYDSGWISPLYGQPNIVKHNLNSTRIFVYILGNTSAWWGVNQIPWREDVYWCTGYEDPKNEIWVYVKPLIVPSAYEQFRVFIWKIPEP